MKTKFDLTQFEDNSPSTTCTVSVFIITCQSTDKTKGAVGGIRGSHSDRSLPPWPVFNLCGEPSPGSQNGYPGGGGNKSDVWLPPYSHVASSSFMCVDKDNPKHYITSTRDNTSTKVYPCPASTFRYS